MIYHYTTRGALIVKSGVIKARPMLVFRDLMATDKVELEPVVWFTINPILDGTVVISEAAQGVRLGPGDLWRFGVADDVAPLGLAEWAEKHGHPPELFTYMVITGKLAGSDYTCWRVCEEDVPKGKWLAVERLYGEEWRAAT